VAIDFLLDVFRQNKQKEAIIWNEQGWSYGWMLEAVQDWKLKARESGLKENSVVALEADFSPNSVMLLLALIDFGCLVVPLSRSIVHKRDDFLRIAQVEQLLKVNEADEVSFEDTGIGVDHQLLLDLKSRRRPGLVLFSSGSTGESKAVLHDFALLLDKFKRRRRALRMITFLLFDHIGGINTLLAILSSGGCAVAVNSRRPDDVCRIIDRYKVQVLPSSPTFLNLILISEAYKRHNLSSLELVTYGTEVMPESTLRKFHQILPNARLKQTYGLSEIGIMNSASKSSDSLWMKLGGAGFQTRIVDGMLEIKARSAMLGYLNAPSPFTEDGWLQTGDAVEVQGEYLKVLGRRSEIINVGGEKVYPGEVEDVLQMLANVEEVSVRGERNPITGQMVVAQVKLVGCETPISFRKRMRQCCQGYLEPFKIPQKVEFVNHSLHGGRFKKIRRLAPGLSGTKS
jgi:long-chain acyl-CoA synthetase